MNSKVVKVLHYVSIMDRGGEETFIMNVFRHIDRTRVMFDFLCMLPQDGAYGPEIKELGGTVWHTDFDRRHDHLKTLDNAFVLRAFLKKHKGEFEAFHIHTQHAMDGVLSSLAAKSAGAKKVIVHSHTTSTLVHLTAHKVCRPFLKFFPISRFACSSDAGRWLFGKGSFHIIKNGISAERFYFDETTRNEVRKEFGWDGKRIIGHVGNFTYPKNHTLMVKIMKELSELEPNTMMVFVGQGDLRPSIEEAKALGISEKIQFLGGRSDTDRLYQGMDLFLFPSIFEGLGIALVEAQTAGLKCITSTAVPEEAVISNNVLRLNIEEAPRLWADKIHAIVNYPRERMEKEIKDSGYDIRDVAATLSNFYLS